MLAAISTTSLALASCTLPYLHSPSLEKATASASDALPNEADALKPFDDQLANLSAFANDENLSVARYWAGVRDAHFARLVALDRAQRARRLTNQIDRRLIELTGGTTHPILVDPTAAMVEKAVEENMAESMRRNFREHVKETPERDLSCEAVAGGISESQAELDLTTGNPAKMMLAQLANLCRRLVTKEAAINQFDKAGGLIGKLKSATAAADKETELSPLSADLERQIEEAKKFAESASAPEQLEEFASRITAMFKGVKPALKFLGVSKLESRIDDVLQAHVCSSEEVDEKTKEEAKCPEMTATSTAGRVSAIWVTAKALAQLSDANASKARSVNWLIGAKAIVAAEKAIAKLKLDEAKALAGASRARLKYAERETRYLIKAKAAGVRTLADCHAAPQGESDPHCQFAIYVGAWNEGRIPGQTLGYRPVQISRSFAVRRSRVIAQKQHALAAAATATLKGYGAGGLRVELIAQALFDAALLAEGGIS